VQDDINYLGIYENTDVLGITSNKKGKYTMYIKNIFLIFCVGISILSSGSCWKIKNKDNKAMCESKFEHKKHCWLIYNKDLQAYCEATAYGKNSCWKIQERDLQAICEAESHQ